MATRKTSKRARVKKTARKGALKRADKRGASAKPASTRNPSRPAGAKKTTKKTVAKIATAKATLVRKTPAAKQARFAAQDVVKPDDVAVGIAVKQALAADGHPPDGKASMSNNYHYTSGAIDSFLKNVQGFLAQANPLFHFNWGPDLANAAMTSLVGALTGLILDKGQWT